MEYVKASKETLRNIKEKVENLSSLLSDVKTNVDSFKNTVFNDTNNWVTNYYKNFYKAPSRSNYMKDGELDGRAYSEAIQANTASAQNTVRKYADNAKLHANDIDEFLPEAINETNSFKEKITRICSLINDFENLVSSDKLNLSKVIDELGENYSVETITVNIDGKDIEVQVLMWTDENGNKYNVSELLNAFYTYTGMNASNAVVLASKGLNNEELENELTNMVNNTAIGVDNQLQRGFFSVASTSGINSMYKDALDKDYDETIIKTEYESILKEQGINSEDYENNLSGLTNSAKLGGMAMAGALMAGLNFKLEPKEEDKEDDKIENNTETSGNTNNGESSSEQTSKQDTPQPEGPEILDEEEPDTLPEEPETPEEPKEPDTPLDPENPEEPPIKQEVSEEEAKEIISQMNNMDKEPSIEKITKNQITSEEIDNQARDEYYKDSETVISNRVKHINEYENMSTEDQIKALEKLGYDHESAVILANNKDKGQTAYIIGMEEQDLTKLSNEIAKNEGISELEHDTKYDNGHSIEYIDSGTANIDMKPISKDVYQAREELTLAKNDYNDSVTIANNAINKANTVKEDYKNILESIQKESGNDPKYWTKEQVEEYNKAVNNYNDAVIEANKEAKIVAEKKAYYEQEKVEYQKIYDEYRKGVIKEVENNIQEDNSNPSMPPSTNDETKNDTPKITDDGIVI